MQQMVQKMNQKKYIFRFIQDFKMAYIYLVLFLFLFLEILTQFGNSITKQSNRSQICIQGNDLEKE